MAVRAGGLQAQVETNPWPASIHDVGCDWEWTISFRLKMKSLL